MTATTSGAQSRSTCFGDVRDPIASAWPAYLDGERSLPEAATALVEALASAR